MTDLQREELLSDHEKFDAYSDESYDLVRALGLELAGKENAIIDEVGVMNRWGSLVIHLFLPDREIERIQKLNSGIKYYGFMVSCSKESSWFKH